jgi:hypothetical protein
MISFAWSEKPGIRGKRGTTGRKPTLTKVPILPILIHVCAVSATQLLAFAR